MVAAVLVAISLSGAGQQVPPPPPQPLNQAPRDPARRPVEPVGTAIIRGRIVTADTGTPIRRAQVSLSPVPPVQPAGATTAPAAGAATSVTLVGRGSIAGTGVMLTNMSMRPKTVTTDSQGAFEFRDLPAGNYRLSASPGQYSAGYLAMAFGAGKPSMPGQFEPGTPIEVADGQTVDKVTVALPRGAVITGRVTDENGDPLARVQVYTISYLPGSSRGMRGGGNATTDDLGQFRLFGLSPTEYVVAAEARGNTFVPPNAPPETEDDKIGFITTYFPTAPDEGTAQRVRTRLGSETPGIEIRMISGRLFHMTGMVTDSQGRPTARANGMLIRRTTTGFSSTYGFSTDAQGHFQMRNIAPGDYRLNVRQQQIGPRNPDGSPVDPGEFASMPVSINSDLDDVLVTTSAGASIAGTVVIEGTPPATGQGAPPLRVTATFADPEGSMGEPTPQPAVVSQDMAFTMKGLNGPMLLRAFGLPQTFVKAVQVGAEDITDTPHEFRSGDRVTIVLTTQASTLEGNVTDATGKPVTDASLLLFSDDKSAWRSNSIRTKRGGADANGHYRIPGLLPGRYYLVALPRDRMNGLSIGADASVFEALSKEATTLVIGEQEQRVVDVKVSTGGKN